MIKPSTWLIYKEVIKLEMLHKAWEWLNLSETGAVGCAIVIVVALVLVFGVELKKPDKER